METLDIGKRAAAYKAIDDFLKDKIVVGIGCGSTVAHAVERLAECVKKENFSVICIASSFTARELIIKHNLVLGELENHPKLDFTIDGGDEVDTKLNMINGSGGYFLRTKTIASCSKDYVIVGDYTKRVPQFGGPGKKAIAIEVVPFAHVSVREKIQSQFGGSVKLRIAPKTAKYGPVVTDNGNFILDWNFPNDINDWEKTNTELSLIPGVLETGIFVKLVTKAYFGMENGTVKEQS